MTAIELYKFIEDNNIENRYETDNETGIRDVLIFPYTFQVHDFYKLLGKSSFDDGGINCQMMDGYFAFWMKDLCEYHGIELQEVFGEDNNN